MVRDCICVCVCVLESERPLSRFWKDKGRRQEEVISEGGTLVLSQLYQQHPCTDVATRQNFSSLIVRSNLHHFHTDVYTNTYMTTRKNMGLLYFR